jgi:transposase
MKKSLVAATFKIGLTTLKRWLLLEQTQHSLAPKPIGGHAPKIQANQYPLLIAQLGQYPDATLDQHCQRWLQEHHTSLSRSTLSRLLKRLKWTYKKKSEGERTRRSSTGGL